MTTGTRLDALEAELADIAERRRKLNARERLLKMERRALEAEELAERQRECIAELEAAVATMTAKAVEAEKVAARRKERIEQLEGGSDRRRLRAIPPERDQEAPGSPLPDFSPSSTRGSPEAVSKGGI